MNQTISVVGMTCQHCVNSVTEELTKLEGIKKVIVDLESGEVDIIADREIMQNDISSAIKEAGYELK
jgi:copper chaperone